MLREQRGEYSADPKAVTDIGAHSQSVCDSDGQMLKSLSGATQSPKAYYFKGTGTEGCGVVTQPE